MGGMRKAANKGSRLMETRSSCYDLPPIPHSRLLQWLGAFLSGSSGSLILQDAPFLRMFWAFGRNLEAPDLGQKRDR
jgi:hypothetical protein